MDLLSPTCSIILAPSSCFIALTSGARLAAPFVDNLGGTIFARGGMDISNEIFCTEGSVIFADNDCEVCLVGVSFRERGGCIASPASVPFMPSVLSVWNV